MKMSQSTRILILLALLVAAVGVWYTLFFSPQTPAEVSAPATDQAAVSKPAPSQVPVTTSARALQVLPIPFLVAEVPEEVPLETEGAGARVALASANVPPNPFVPLRPPKATATAPSEVPEEQKPVTIAPEPELPANIPLPKVVTPENGTVAPPPVTLGQGTLPVKLTPLAQEVEPQAPLEEEVPEPVVEEPVQPEEPEEPPPNPLLEWAGLNGLKLDGVALGPVSVAIFKTVSGYLALPVGQTFPDKNVLVKTITAERVLLVDDSGTHTLTLELGGGE
ncbi:MAG TPA: hypothetical protein ENK37_01265 [Oceanithermus profundus]|uniref:Competence protein n=1 Tax=Oceanithermus profundus TaxID=187137 RepID=A0A7C4Z420_9DEIN|nr:hypothetical protein [Oceanithermus profundus]